MKYLWMALSLLGVFVASAADAQSTLPQCAPDDVRWTNCQGTRTSSDGGDYIGEFRDGKFDGHGTFTWADGDKYVGEFLDGKKHGQGTFTWADGDKYVGEFLDGKKHGQGTLTWADGSKYVGEFLDGKFSGQGTLTWADGSKYVGEFRDGKCDGQGAIFAPDGSVKTSGIWEVEKAEIKKHSVDTSTNTAPASTAEASWMRPIPRATDAD